MSRGPEWSQTQMRWQRFFIHAAFFSGFQSHFSELRAALEFSPGGLVLCQQQSSLGSTSFWIRYVNILTQRTPTLAQYDSSREWTLHSGCLPQTNNWKPSDELTCFYFIQCIQIMQASLLLTPRRAGIIDGLDVDIHIKNAFICHVNNKPKHSRELIHKLVIC